MKNIHPNNFYNFFKDCYRLDNKEFAGYFNENEGKHFFIDLIGYPGQFKGAFHKIMRF